MNFEKTLLYQKEKETKYWALYYHVFQTMKKGLTVAEASIKFVGEQLEAAQYFNAYLQSEAKPVE